MQTGQLRRSLRRFTPLFFLPLALACGAEAGGDKKKGQEAPLETVDVTTSIQVSPDRDTRAAPRKATLAGVLPSDFPSAELPIYVPSSVIDFGKANGRRFVLLQSPNERSEVEAGWRSLLTARQIRVQNREGVWELLKGERRLASAAFAKISGGTQIRLEY